MARIFLQDLLQSSDSDWCKLVAPVVERLKEKLPLGSEVTLEPDKTISATWKDGVSRFQLAEVIDDMLGKSSNFADETYIAWPGITLATHQAKGNKVTGFALLSSLLAGPCEKCPGSNFPEAGSMAFSEAMERPHAEFLETHPNLQGLKAFGVEESFINSLAELIGGLLEGEDEYGVVQFGHDRGHLPGLVELHKNLIV